MSDEAATPAPIPYEEAFRERFGDGLQEAVHAVGAPTFTIKVEQIQEAAKFLKQDLHFMLPVLCSAVDWEDRFEVIWHANNMDTREIVALKVILDHDEPRVASLTPVWAGMNWHEREQFDLLGIQFEGHPDLRRILLPDDWEGHPLRKDYTTID